MKTNRDLLIASFGEIFDPEGLAQIIEETLPRANREVLNKVLTDEEYEEKLKRLRAEQPAFEAACFEAMLDDLKARISNEQ